VTRLLATILALGAALAPATANAADALPVDINKLPYQPIGHFKPGETIPPDYETICDQTMKPLMSGKLFNPSGVWNSMDSSIFETSCLPYRDQGDTNANDVWGNGGQGEKRHGYCAGADPMSPDPTSEEAAGTCPNHQLEYIDYFKATMMEILKDFSPTFHEYPFEEDDGLGINPAVVVAGADHPDENIIIGSHYDQTKTGPASHWDSQEGHAEMIRVAKLMADYWHATGTRPSATIKFMPMDGEEDGTLGSKAYVEQYIVPDQESKVRGYWNADPCAGGYPARRYGNPGDIVPINVQIGDSTDARVEAFNAGAKKIVEDTLDHLDDTIAQYPDNPEVFVSTAEGLPAIGGDVDKHIFVTKEHPVLFGSDWANFIAVGIPFFNPGPKVTGPSNGADPTLLTLQGNTPDALVGFHTPLDNMQTQSRYTGADPTGSVWSEAYAKGMEMCSHMLAYGMLQPGQGGAQTATTDPVAYFEAQPNEAEKGNFVTFDAGGSHQYADVAGRKLVADQDLQYKWTYGDGRTAYGKVVKHAYKQTGTFTAKLTVTNRDSGKSASMELPVVVEEGTGADVDPAGQDTDTLPDRGAVVACKSSLGFAELKVTPKGKGLEFAFQRNSNNPVKINVFRASDGRKAKSPKRVAKFEATESFAWKGKRLPKGDYYVTVTALNPNSQQDTRTFAFTRKGSKFKAAKAFTRTDSCELVSLFRLGGPVFGGKTPLRIAFATTQPTKVTITLLRGKKVAKRITRNVTAANRVNRVNVKPKKLRKGAYTVRLSAGSQTESLLAKKL
jgi:PKD repeat protein